MLSTVGPELTDFINPELSWKKVTKGYRRTARRSRRSAARSLNVGAELGNKSPNRVWGSSVFESEKCSDKVAHVPIKKRRLPLCSASPPPWTPLSHREESLSPQPQTPSPRPEESERLLDYKYASGQRFRPESLSKRQKRSSNGSIAFELSNDVDGVMDGELSKMIGGRHCYSEDFSGIALLAAAACISSIDDDFDKAKQEPIVEEFSTSEGFNSSASTIPPRETIASTGIGNCCHTGFGDEHNKDGSFLQDNLVTVAINHSKEIGGAVRSVASKDDRRHWDLNTVMDAWEQPCNDPIDYFQAKGSESALEDGMQRKKSENREYFETQMHSEDVQCNFESEVQSTERNISADVHEHHTHSDSKSTSIEIFRSKLEENNCSNVNRSCVDVKHASTPNGCALEPSDCGADCADTKDFCQVLSKDCFKDNSSCLASHDVSITFNSEEKINMASAAAVMHNNEDCFRTAVTQLGRTLECAEAGKLDVALPDVPGSATAVGEKNIQSQDGEDFGKPLGLSDKGTFPGEVSIKMVDVENSVSSSTKVDPSHPSPKSEDFSVASKGDCLPVLVNAKMQDDEGPAADAIENDPSADTGLGEAQDDFNSQESSKSYGEYPTSCSSMIALPFDDCHKSHVMAGVENMTELQEGYDSPFEDGELRESVAYPWEEYEIEYEETECVDYESDDREGDDFDAVDHSVLEEAEIGHGASHTSDEGSSFVRKFTEVLSNQSGSVETSDMRPKEHLTEKNDNGKVGIAEKQGVNARSGTAVELSSDLAMEANDGTRRKTRYSDPIGEVGYVEVVGSKASKGKLLSRIEGPSSFDGLNRKDVRLIKQGRSHSLGGSYYQAERDFDSEKPMGRDRSLHVHSRRNEADDQWVDSSVGYWHPRNSYSYRGPSGQGHPKPRSIDSAAKVGGLNSHDHRSITNYFPKGMYRPSIRRSSPVERDECYGVWRGMALVRSMNRGRSRGRPGMYPKGFCRGPREEYHDSLHDDGSAPPVRLPHYFARRDRSFSPTFARGAHISRPLRRSHSRSRSRSPPEWNMHRERNPGTRRCGRLPDFRSEGRPERMRLPFQKPSFSTDYDGRLQSSPKGHFSPQHNSSRWADARNYVDDQLRGRRSPPRMFRQSQRFDAVGYSGRMKPYGYNRPTVHPKRFPLMAGASSRVHNKYDESEDDRRKHDDDRYEMIHRVRRYDACGAVRRFRYDEEDSVEEARISANNNEDGCIKDGDQRDARRRSAKEDKEAPYYRHNNNDRLHAGASSSGNLRVKDEDSPSPRGG